MTNFAIDADATFLERHLAAVVVVLLVLLAGAAVTSIDRSLLTVVADALTAGVAR